MVSNLKNKESKLAVEMGPEPSPPECKTSLVQLKPTIEDIHDRSENEENTASKTSMKNVLYESGKCELHAAFFRFAYALSYACTHIFHTYYLFFLSHTHTHTHITYMHTHVHTLNSQLQNPRSQIFSQKSKLMQENKLHYVWISSASPNPPSLGHSKAP